MAFNYWPRIIDATLKEKMTYSGATLVRGPKWVGKTSSCEQLAKSALYMRDPDEYAANMEAAYVQPSVLLRGEKPRLIDEWQVAPVLWDAVVNAVDKSKGEKGQFPLTGSATPRDPDKIKHSGTGRITRLTMRSMSLFESKESSGEVSLKTLFENETIKEIEGVSPLSVEDIAFVISRGGWPESVLNASSKSLIMPYDYIDSLIESDIATTRNTKAYPDKAHALLHSLARCTAQAASLATILDDMSGDGISMAEKTLVSYIEALRKLYVIEDVKAWAPNLRSKTPLRTSPIWHLTDPSLAVAALKTGPEELLNDLPTMGYLFESLCVRDLRVYLEELGGEVYHYRDKSGLEVDAILKLQDGRWGAAEIKLGGDVRIEEGASNLNKLVKKLDIKKGSPPVFKMVITGGKYAYCRPNDGVYVVPLGCLAP